MTKSTQSSFASRIGKAQTLYNAVKDFDSFNASGSNDLTAETIKARVEALFKLEDNYTTKRDVYAAATRERLSLFIDETDTLGKRMTRVKNYTEARFGKNSGKAENVKRHVMLIRGNKPAKVTFESGEKSISRSERSYSAQHVNLRNLITTLSAFGPDYVPDNQAITIAALNSLEEQIKVANDHASEAFNHYKSLVAQRVDAFNKLAILARRIKQMVLAQYGRDSEEYKRVKGLQFQLVK